MRGRTIFLVAVLAALTACTQFPEIDAARDRPALPAAYPDLLPLDTLLASAPALPAGDPAAALEARAAALKARADRLRNAPIE